MKIDFNEIPEKTLPCMNGGTGEMTVRFFADDNLKIIPCKIHKGGCIGEHMHTSSDDINYVLSGFGKAVCNGRKEILTPGVCHICKKGSSHSITNTGDDDLIILTVVTEK